VIGFVGQTGLATGPHVCFRIQKNGKYVDPSGLRMPAGAPIARAQVPVFRATRDARLAELGGQRRVADGE
jgi:murein DD-endopeptidase MepM/ murein hydrolase activator NlpD